MQLVSNTCYACDVDDPLAEKVNISVTLYCDLYLRSDKTRK